MGVSSDGSGELGGGGLLQNPCLKWSVLIELIPHSRPYLPLFLLLFLLAKMARTEGPLAELHTHRITSFFIVMAGEMFCGRDVAQR